MLKIDEVLGRLAKNAGTMSNTIESARRRTRAVERALKGVATLDPVRTRELLETEAEEPDAAEAAI